MATDKTIKVSASNIKLAFWLVTILFFMWGVSYGLIDVMNKNFQNQLGITKATSGLLQAAYFGGYFVIATPAALVARKFGFKGGIIMGLALYAIGALLIIPASNAYSFNMFLGAFFILACGLGSLETNANPYITKLGDDKDAAFRINIAQIFNGVGQFLGPIMVVHYFYQSLMVVMLPIICVVYRWYMLELLQLLLLCYYFLYLTNYQKVLRFLAPQIH